MGLPGKKIQQALKATKSGHQDEQPEQNGSKVEGALESKLVKESPDRKKPQKKVTKNETKPKLGRKRTVEEKREPITLYLTEDTLTALQAALPFEKRKAKKIGLGMDQSYLIETAVKEWLKKNDYNI